MKRLRYSMICLLVLALVMILAGPASAAYNVKQSWVRFSATAGETLAAGDVVCIKDADGYAYEADANDSNLRPAVGIIGKGGSSGDSVEIVVVGIFNGWSSLSEGAWAYLSETASAVTQSAPSYAQVIGKAITTTDYYFNFSNYNDTSAVTALGVLSGESPFELEGATADDYETSIQVTDPTADNTLTVVDDTGAFIISELETNSPDAANSIWGESNKIVAEGATADAYETSLTFTDPTAARTVTFPNASGTVMLGLTSGETNAVEFGNNSIVTEGSVQDAHEGTLTFENPTADRTYTIPDYTGAVPIVIGQGYTQTSSGETPAADITGTSLTLADGWFTEGKTIEYDLAGVVTGANGTISVGLYFEDALVMTLTTADGAAGDWSANIKIVAVSATAQRIVGVLRAEAGAEVITDYATDNTDIGAAGTIPIKCQVALGNGADAITNEYVLIKHWSKTD